VKFSSQVIGLFPQSQQSSVPLVDWVEIDIVFSNLFYQMNFPNAPKRNKVTAVLNFILIINNLNGQYDEL